MVANNAYTEIGFNVQAVGPLIQQIELYNSQPIFWRNSTHAASN